MAKVCEGFVASDIKLTVDNAARKALAQQTEISMVFLQAALKETSPSLTEAELAAFNQFQSL